MTVCDRSGPGRRSVAALACGALAAGGHAAAGVTAVTPGAADASSHREAPLVSGQPQYDTTDVYAFVSPDKPDTTTLVANWLPFEEPAGGRGGCRSGRPARTCRSSEQRVVSAEKIADDLPVAPSNVGEASLSGYGKLRAQAVKPPHGGTTAFAGQADDPFFLDLRVFDLLYGGALSEVGRDTLKGYNVNTVALQVPTKSIRQSAGRPVVGVWSGT